MVKYLEHIPPPGYASVLEVFINFKLTIALNNRQFWKFEIRVNKRQDSVLGKKNVCFRFALILTSK